MVPEGWRELRLGQITRESKDRNGDQLTEQSLYAVTKVEGLVPMRDRVKGSAVDRCKLVRSRAFAYNPMRLNIGSIARWSGDNDVIVSPDYVVFECDPHQLDSRYIDQYRRGTRWARFVEDAGKGSVRVRIYYSNLAEMVIPLPPLSEQRQIAAILGSVDEAIQATQAVIEQTRTVKQGLLRELLSRGIGHTRFKQAEIGEVPEGWEVRSIESLLAAVDTPMRSGPFGSALLKHELVSEGIPFLGIDNVHRERFVPKYRRFVTPEKFRGLKRYSVSPGDVMITIMGTVGRCCVVPDDVGQALSSKHVWTMTFDPSVYRPDLICLQLNYAPWVLAHFARAAQGGIMEAISSQTLRTTLLPCPPREEQEQIANVLRACSDSIVGAERELARLEQSKRGLLHDLLTGRVRVGGG